jgi:hypothetical protein
MIHSSCAILLGRFAPGTETTPHPNQLTYSPTPAAEYDAPMNFTDIATCVRRLERLSIGLAKEISI